MQLKTGIGACEKLEHTMKEKFTFIEFRGRTVIDFTLQKFDLFVVPEISKIIETSIKEWGFPDLIIDITKITSIDSSGFGFLISTKNTIDRHGREAVLVCDNDGIMHIIGILNMSRVLKIFKTRGEAAEYLDKRTE
jgi:anti-anti-sigma factor